jgi:hypothetical protein
LFSVNTYCNGTECSTEAWFLSVLLLLALGIAGVPVVLFAILGAIAWLGARVPR